MRIRSFLASYGVASTRRGPTSCDTRLPCEQGVRRFIRFRSDWAIDPTDPSSSYSPFLIESKAWVIDFGPATAHWSSDPNVITLSIDLAGPDHEILEQIARRL